MSGCISSRLKFGNETFEKPHRATLKQSSYPKIGERIFFLNISFLSRNIEIYTS